MNDKKREAIKKRKREHLRIALSDDVQIGNPGFSSFRLVHNALPEIDFNEVDASTTFLGKKVSYPFFISCMTGGVKEGAKLNRNLAKTSQKYNIAMGVGSQRIAIEHPEYKKLFKIRKYAPDVPVIANLGLVQLNYGFGISECEEAVKMVKADALAFHLNPIQEALQPEGDTNFGGLLAKLASIVNKLSVPVVVKEVGFGLSEDVIRKFFNIGVRCFDTAGWGGTNWACVEYGRQKETEGVNRVFEKWGISTVDSVLAAKKVKDEKKDKKFKIIASGGVRTGVDVAKAICLGADMVGIAAPFAKAGLKSVNEVEKLTCQLGNELKIAMFGVGIKKLVDLNPECLSPF